jgi:hypothetical protein
MSLRSAILVLLISPWGCSSILDGGMAAGGAGSGGAGGSGGSGSQVESCSQAGATRACCDTGMQVCGGSSEFLTWGPCHDASGGELSCCVPSEFTTCDGGMPSLPPMPALCKAGGANNEPEILIGYAPANNETVGATGQIKVWINDEGAAIIAPGEMVDANSGAITKPGDRTAKAADGYLWEPALYIAPQTAENGGTPHFPSAIRGYYNSTTIKGAGTLVAGMDPPPAGSQPLTEKYSTEDIWDVSSLGLAPGSYIAEFVIHDGDRDRGVGCVTIVITATQ